jgi:hypothetical protein
VPGGSIRRDSRPTPQARAPISASEQGQHDQRGRGPQPAGDVEVALALQQGDLGTKPRVLLAPPGISSASIAASAGQEDGRGRERAAVVHAQQRLPVAVDGTGCVERYVPGPGALEPVDDQAARPARRSAAPTPGRPPACRVEGDLGGGHAPRRRA